MNALPLSPETLVARLKSAGDIVRRDLALVGSHAGYQWPGTPSRIWNGYSYEIPKEEQIRSAFWARLHDRETMVCELEWNHYEQNGRVTATGEIDLVGFALNGESRAPVLLLEFKRVWALSGWYNKTAEMREGIARDQRKLQRVLKSLKGCSAAAPLAGVVVVACSDDPTQLGSDSQWNVWPGESASWEEIWSSDQPLCNSEIDDGKERKIYSRADLLIVQ